MRFDDEAIKKAYPNAVLINEETGTFDSNGNKITLVQSDIDAARAALDKEFADNKYQRDRAAEYPSVVDQLDDIYHNGIDGWKATIKATKDKYPKP